MSASLPADGRLDPEEGTLAARAGARSTWTLSSDLLAGLAVLALWLITRPYRGVRHDAILYLGQVLDRLMPDRLGSDLFFLYGSQDRWSLFSPLMAPLVARFGIAGPEMVLLVACEIAFMFACWKLTQDWPSRTLRWGAMMLIAVLPHTYGGLGAFSFAEPFLTARSLAEPLALLALWQVMRGRLSVAVPLAIAAGAFHPLVLLPILAIGWIYLVLEKRSWLWLLALLLVPAVVGAFGVAPFDAIWQRFDAAWFVGAHMTNESAFVATYGVLDWAPVAFDALVLLLVLRTDAARSLGRLVAATLLGVVLLTIVWGVGVDLLHDVLLTQIQLWRVYLPLHLFAVLMLPIVVEHYARRGWVGLWCISALALAALAVMSNWDTGWVCVGWALVSLAVEHWQARVAKSTALAAIFASCVTMLMISLKVANVTLQAVTMAPDRFDNADGMLVVLGLPLVGALLALGILWLLLRGGRARAAALVAVAVGLAYGTWMWDQRSDWQRRLESSFEAGPPAFDADIPPTASVYWDNDVATPWMLARRANFYSNFQGAGLLFNRGTALEFLRRRKAMAPLEIQQEVCATINALTASTGNPAMSCDVTREVAVTLCQATPHPDFLVFATPLSTPAVAEWHHVSPRSGKIDKSFYLYQCSTLH